MLQAFAYLFPYLHAIRFRLYIASILVIVSVSCSFIPPYIFTLIIDSLSINNSTSPLLIGVLLCGYGICWIMNCVFMQIRTIVIHTILEQSKKQVSIAIANKLLSLTTRFHEERKIGELTSAIDKAQQGLDNIFWGLFLFFMPTILEIAFISYIISSSCSVIYGIILCMIFLLYSYLNYRASGVMTTLQLEHNRVCAQVSAHLVDMLLNIETVKYFSQEYYEHMRISQLLHKQEDCAIKRWKHDTWLQIKQMLIIGIGIWIITVYTGYATYAKNLSLGTFLLINTYLLQCMIPLSNIGYIMHQVRKGLQDMLMILRLLQESSEIQDPIKPSNLVLMKPYLVIQHVSFGYTSDRTILRDISFSVHPGQTLAIVGSSGSGKSTIAKLIVRFYDVVSGNILLNGTDIRMITQQSLRSMIGVVSQDAQLFNTTLHANIAYGDLTASAQEIDRAAERAQLGPLIASLPQGYETIVGERGVKLSGGEKQRIAIARMLLKKPLLYIFDEATSSLDSRTEQEIQKSVRSITAGMTTIIIAHRLSTIMHADYIIVLNNGQIIEQGTHETLLQKNMLYTHLWNVQQQSSLDDDRPM